MYARRHHHRHIIMIASVSMPYLLVVYALRFRDAAVTHQQTLVPLLKNIHQWKGHHTTKT